METQTVMAIQIDQRTEAAPEVQQILTDYGCLIETRIGLHEQKRDDCSNQGLILLVLNGRAEEANKLESELEAVHNRVTTRRMELADQ